MAKIELEFDTVYKTANEKGILPRYHGNGFVQLDIDGAKRLNVWPAQRMHVQKVNTQIHNHRFSFKSRVIAGNGKLINKVYKPWMTPKGDMNLYTAQPSNGENTELVLLTPDRCFMIVQSENRIWNEYSMEIGEFHESLTEGLVMTLMEKTGQSEPKSVIACPIDKYPDNSFNRHNTVSVEDCWDILRDGFKNINRHWVNPYEIKG